MGASSLTYDLTTQRGCMFALAELRHCARYAAITADALHALNRADSRAERILRERGGPFDLRQADVIAARIKHRREVTEPSRAERRRIGETLFGIASEVDAMVPRDVLLDLLNVNPVDRAKLEDGDGLVEIVFGRGLENSAEHRHKDYRDGPLFQAAQARCMHEMIHNCALRQSMDDALFGKGGMFEFLPRYTQQPDGTMRRLPPPLRAADADVDGAERSGAAA